EDVVALADEARVGTHTDEHVHVARTAAECATVSLARQADALAVVDARRDVDVDRALVDRAARAAAVLARVLDDPAAASAVPARRRPDELAEDAARDLLQPAAAPASAAARDGRPGRDAVAATGAAHDRDLERDARGLAARRFDEVDRHLGGDIRTTRAPGGAARRGAEEVLPEEGREEVAEVAEVEVRRREAAGAQPGVTEAIVELARLGVREHLVRLRD